MNFGSPINAPQPSAQPEPDIFAAFQEPAQH